MKNKPPWGAGPVGAQPLSASARAGDVKGLLGQAVAFHRAGLLGEAEKLYHGVLAVQPKNFDGLHLLGVIYLQRGECAVHAVD